MYVHVCVHVICYRFRFKQSIKTEKYLFLCIYIYIKKNINNVKKRKRMTKMFVYCWWFFFFINDPLGRTFFWGFKRKCTFFFQTIYLYNITYNVCVYYAWFPRRVAFCTIADENRRQNVWNLLLINPLSSNAYSEAIFFDISEIIGRFLIFSFVNRSKS